MNYISQISIIIPTKDRLNVLKQTIKSVFDASEQFEIEIIVVNDSENELELGISDLRLKIIRNSGNGVASARNRGASESKYDFLLFIDDDIILQEDTLKLLIDFLYKYPNSCVNFNWIYPPATKQIMLETKFGRYLNNFGFDSLKGWLGEGLFVDNSIFEVNNLAAFFLPISKQIYINIQGFNESFPYAGAEDYDFSKRLKDQGYLLYLNTTHTIYHNESDRLVLKAWLERKERNGVTKKVAVDLGYDSLRLNVYGYRKLLYKLIYFNRNVLLVFLKIIPNHELFDIIFGYLVNRLLAAYQYNGYSKFSTRNL